MDDLLKEAIADAKAVRETALENAKMALEEAFTPRLKSMLSQKIQNELEDEDGEEAMDDEEEAPEEGAYHEDDEDPSDADSEMDMEPEDEEPEEGLDMEGVIEINGVKYAPVIEQDEEGEDEAGEDEEEMEEEDLDLEAVIKELEAELDESEETDEVTEEEEIDEDKEEVDEENNPFWTTEDYVKCIRILRVTNQNSRAIDIGAPLLTIATKGNLDWALDTLNAINELTSKNYIDNDQSWQIEL